MNYPMNCTDDLNAMIIVVPAYQPDAKLLRLLDQIRLADACQKILVVDDGSGPDYQDVFAAAAEHGATVIGHPLDRGKGCALKCGFTYVAENFPNQAIVSADCDGQHTYTDIQRVGLEVGLHERTMVLGARDFSASFPTRSRVGNTATKYLFRLATGTRLNDTQTGLRGYPSALLHRGERVLTLPPDRRFGTWLCLASPVRLTASAAAMDLPAGRGFHTKSFPSAHSDVTLAG